MGEWDGEEDREALPLPLLDTDTEKERTVGNGVEEAVRERVKEALLLPKAFPREGLASPLRLTATVAEMVGVTEAVPPPIPPPERESPPALAPPPVTLTVEEMVMVSEGEEEAEGVGEVVAPPAAAPAPATPPALPPPPGLPVGDLLGMAVPESEIALVAVPPTPLPLIMEEAEGEGDSVLPPIPPPPPVVPVGRSCVGVEVMVCTPGV